jgi:hypothetical protein
VSNAEDKTFKYGTLPDTVPDITGGYSADASWSSVWPSTLYTLWHAYGDAAPVARYWPGVLAFVNATFAGLDKHGDAFSQFGDWCPPPAVQGGGQGPKPKPSCVYCALARPPAAPASATLTNPKTPTRPRAPA